MGGGDRRGSGGGGVLLSGRTNGYIDVKGAWISEV